MGRLVVVSNRVAAPTEKKVATGGLAIAVLDALRASGGMWFGWSGRIVEDSERCTNVSEADGLTYATIDLTRQDYEEYYNGFANRTLWPVLHYRTDQIAFDRQSLAGYRRVNAQFVEQLRQLLQPDDTVWVHDYHLIPFAAALRKIGFDGPIGFFLHTPFPPCELLRTLPFHREIMEALCTYDLVGFQTDRDLSGFYDYVLHEVSGAIGGDGAVHAFGRRLRAVALPISIESESFSRMAKDASRSPTLARLKQSVAERALIIGVDRLDYSKGLVERFHAFERLLIAHPDTRNHATFMQIAPLSRTDVPEYAEIRRTLEESAGHINGQYAELDWMPIRYLNRSLQRRTLAGLLRFADVGMVTPLRDGMNLVAKEFVAAQVPEDPGVLVLSEFAGAAEELSDAVLVNPYDIDGVAEALHTALSMPLDERIGRWKSMYDIVVHHNIAVWRDRFLTALTEVRHG